MIEQIVEQIEDLLTSHPDAEQVGVLCGQCGLRLMVTPDDRAEFGSRMRAHLDLCPSLTTINPQLN